MAQGCRAGRRRAAAAAGLVWLLLAPWAAPADAASLEDYRRQQAAVQAALSQAQEAYRTAQRSWADAHARLVAVSTEIARIDAQVADLDRQMGEARSQASQLQVRIGETRARLDTLQRQADAGLVLVAQHGLVSFSSVLLGARSFFDFLTRLQFLRRIWSHEMDLLRATRDVWRQLHDQLGQLQAQMDRLQTLQAQAAERRQALEGQRREAERLKAEEDRAVAAAAAAIAQLTRQERSIAEAIQRLLAGLRGGQLSWEQVVALVQDLAQRFGIDPRLVEAVILAESGGDPQARSSVGAEGLMQLMPGTAAALGVDNPFDPAQNIRGGITYLLQLLQRFHGNLALALAAYNAGPGAVEKYGGVPPYQETQAYVQHVLDLYRQGK